MYIRTKDGRIAEVKENMDIKRCSENVLRLVYKDNRSICVLKGNDDITKEADTIEELCDEFVVIRDSTKTNQLVRTDSIGYLKEMIKEDKRIVEIKGAIWTGWGLKYVAKMTNEGKLELI